MKKFYLIFGTFAALISGLVLPASPREYQVTIDTVDPRSPEALMKAAIAAAAAKPSVPAPVLPNPSATMPAPSAPPLPSSGNTEIATSSWWDWPSLPKISLPTLSLPKISLPEISFSPSRLAQTTWSYTKKPLACLAAAYILKRNFSENVQRTGHSAHLTQQDNITALNLTITIRKNGWCDTATFAINVGDDPDAGYHAFQALLNNNLTDGQKNTVHYAPAPAGNVAILEQNETYRISIEGTVTYQHFGEFTLTKETTVETVQFGRPENVLAVAAEQQGDSESEEESGSEEGTGDEEESDSEDEDANEALPNQPRNKGEWIQNLWKKLVAARITPIWQPLPLDLVPATGTTTYRTTISYQGEVKGFAIRGVRFDLSNEICTLEASSLPGLKGKIIDALADHILPGRPQLLQVQLSIITPKDRFVSMPIQIALDTPHDEAFVIRIPAFPAHNLIPPIPAPFIHNPHEQQQRAAALWRPNFEPVCGVVNDLPQEPWTSEKIAKRIGISIIFLFASWKLFPKLADGTRVFSGACGDFLTGARSTLSFQ